MEQALHDTEEFVIARALQAMGALSHLGLFDTEAMVLVGTRVVPLLCHPRYRHPHDFLFLWFFLSLQQYVCLWRSIWL